MSQTIAAERTVVTETGARVPVLQHPAPDPAWLARSPEPAIDPALPIIDPHHHLWDRGGGYFLDELLADIQSGHNVVSTVFLQCAYGYRTDGPEALIERLAECPNVSVKLGGLAMLTTGFDFHKRPEPPHSDALLAAWRPYLDVCIEAFGPSRSMFESNFPVDKAMCSYTAMWNAFKRAAAGYSPDDKAAMFHDTAARVYRLSGRMA